MVYEPEPKNCPNCGEYVSECDGSCFNKDHQLIVDKKTTYPTMIQTTVITLAFFYTIYKIAELFA